MKIDLYTKGVLSVIAACLVWLCLNGLTPAATAQTVPDRPLRVVLVDESGMPAIGGQGLRVNLGPQLLPVSVNGVNLGAQVLPVSVNGIERRGTWQPILVDVIRPAPTLMPVP